MTSIGVNIAILKANEILLIKREDFEVWCLPGGGLDPGESFAKAAIREAQEETGLKVELDNLVGIYSRTGNGHSYDHIVVFKAHPIGGSLQPQKGEALDVPAEVHVDRGQLRLRPQQSARAVSGDGEGHRAENSGP